jgi:DNA-directed RNA polymerase subunit RPC12/RpoP
MPVKVRCSECQHVVNAPDRARGKAVKCPQCGHAIRVPAEKAAPATPGAQKAGAPPPSGSMVIANLNLEQLEDAQTRICPKCGAEVSAEDVVCPECQVNLVTGLLSAELQADRARKGPNPKKYYGEFFGDSLEFWKKNKKLSITLSWNCALFASIGAFCALAAIWCTKPLVKDFWWFLTVVAVMIPPGLAWDLHTSIIDATLRKKKKLPKHHFEKLLGAALGFKFIFWFLDVGAPFHFLALIFLLLHFPLVAIGLEVPAVVFAALLFPLAMTHMSMPVTIKGWLLNKMSGPFFRTLPALAYWAFFLLLIMLVPIGCLAGGAILGGNGIAKMIADSDYNTVVFTKQAEIDNLPKIAIVPPELSEWRGKNPANLDYSPFWIPAGLFIVASGFFGATAVILMRANGLYARYFLDYLDLDAMERETKYVAKVSRLDQIEGPKGLTWKTVFAALGLLGVFAFAFGGGGAAATGKDFLLGVGTGLIIAGGCAMLVGHFWLLFEAFKDSMAWFGAISLSTTFGGAAFPFVGPLGFLLTPLLSLVYGAINWSNAKFALVVEIVGTFVFVPLGLIILLVWLGPEFLGFGGGEAAAAP